MALVQDTEVAIITNPPHMQGKTGGGQADVPNTRGAVTAMAVRASFAIASTPNTWRQPGLTKIPGNIYDVIKHSKESMPLWILLTYLKKVMHIKVDIHP